MIDVLALRARTPRTFLLALLSTVLIDLNCQHGVITNTKHGELRELDDFHKILLFLFGLLRCWYCFLLLGFFVDILLTMSMMTLLQTVQRDLIIEQYRVPVC